MVVDRPPSSHPFHDVDLAHTLAPVCAKDLDGNTVRFGTLWEERPAVLVFLRHFG